MKKERNVKRKLSVKKIAFVVAVCFVAVMSVNLIPRFSYYDNRISELKGSISEQEKLNAELSQEQNMYSSKEYIERIAREQLGLVRANEKVYIDSNNKESE